MPPNRTLVGGWTPAAATRQQRRTNRRATRDLLKRATVADRIEARASYEQERRSRREISYLPSGGESVPAALRSYLRFTVAAHRATSATLGGAYPFLAEGGLGSEGIIIGRDLYSGGTFCYDPWVLYARGLLTNPNALIAGVIGSGKSTLAKAITTRSIAFGRRVYVPGDPKGEWSQVTEAAGGTVIGLGQGMPGRLNPLDEGPRPHGVDDYTWRGMVWRRRRSLVSTITETVLARPLSPTERSALDAALVAADTVTDPTLPAVVAALLDPTEEAARANGDQVITLREDGRQVAHALRRLVHGDLSGLFDGPSTVSFDTSAPMISIDLSRIAANDDLLAIVMSCASSWMEAGLTDPAAPPRWVVYDEAWRIIRHLALLRRMQEQWKLARALGIANLMIIHRLSDIDSVGDSSSEARGLAAGLLADCSTRIVYRQESDQLDRSASALGLTGPERELLPTLSRGVGLWRVGQRSFVVHNLRAGAETALFDTDGRMGATVAPSARPAILEPGVDSAEATIPGATR